MVATFILARAFAISAMLVGAISSAYAAPVPTALKPREVEERNCRILGCLFAEPHHTTLLSEPENESLSAVESVESELSPALEGLESTPSPELHSRNMLTNYIAEPADSNIFGDAAPIGRADIAQPDIDLVTDVHHAKRFSPPSDSENS